MQASCERQLFRSSPLATFELKVYLLVVGHGFQANSRIMQCMYVCSIVKRKLIMDTIIKVDVCDVTAIYLTALLVHYAIRV